MWARRSCHSWSGVSNAPCYHLRYAVAGDDGLGVDKVDLRSFLGNETDGQKADTDFGSIKDVADGAVHTGSVDES